MKQLAKISLVGRGQSALVARCLISFILYS
jgi:hypothetical protein